MLGSILSGLASAFKALAVGLGLIQQNKDQSSGAIAQQVSDQAGVLHDVETSEKAENAIATGNRASINRLLIDDARSDGK